MTTKHRSTQQQCIVRESVVCVQGRESVREGGTELQLLQVEPSQQQQHYFQLFQIFFPCSD